MVSDAAYIAGKGQVMKVVLLDTAGRPLRVDTVENLDPSAGRSCAESRGIRQGCQKSEHREQICRRANLGVRKMCKLLRR